MAKESLKLLTESMFYVLMAFSKGPACGTDVATFVEKKTAKSVPMGPATLYTILAKFEKAEYIREIQVEGRKRTYELTSLGAQAYREEVERLQRCLSHAEEESL